MALQHQIPKATEERVPWQQRLLDDIPLLLILGIVVPTLFYIVWGIVELASVPATSAAATAATAASQMRMGH